MPRIEATLAALLLSWVAYAQAEDTVQHRNCIRDMEHPTMKKDKHPFMQCQVAIQGVEITLLMPDDDEFPGNFWETDFKKYDTPKLLPPFTRKQIPPFSLYGVQEGSVVLDIGANYGVFTILIAKFFPGVKVIAVEPVDWMNILLKKNLQLNSITEDQVAVISKPITKDGRDVDFYQNFLFNQFSNIYVEAHDPPGVHLIGPKSYSIAKPAKSITLQELLSKEGFGEKVSFASIDCAGCEQEIMDEVAKLGIPFFMECHAPEKNSKFASREWDEFQWLTNITQQEAQRCLDLQELGENLLLAQAADRGRPVETAMVGLQILAEGNYSAAISELSRAIDAKSQQPLPTGSVKEQYDILAVAFQAIASFFVASAVDEGHVFKQDKQEALDLFITVAQSGQRLREMEADLDRIYRELPVLPDAQTGAMFRAGEILEQRGEHEEAVSWWTAAAEAGHAVARARLQKVLGGPLVGTNGRVKGTATRQLMTQARMNALGIPQSLHQTILGATPSEAFDECMRSDQERNLPRWEDVFAGQGSKYDSLGAYRFRSWLHSAMECMLAA